MPRWPSLSVPDDGSGANPLITPTLAAAPRAGLARAGPDTKPASMLRAGGQGNVSRGCEAALRDRRLRACVARVIALMPSIIAELLRHRQCRRHGEAPSGTIH